MELFACNCVVRKGEKIYLGKDTLLANGHSELLHRQIKL